MTTQATKKPGATASKGARKTRTVEDMYTPVNISRSDGVFWETAQVLESFSEPLDELDRDVRRWASTLGKALKILFSWPPDVNYYVTLPQNYVVRAKPTKRKSDKERRDTFVFGHPAGYNDSCLFRSPSEFTPHLLWLMSDSNDPSLCMCKVCTRTAGPSRQPESQRQVPAVQSTPVPAASGGAAGAVPAPARPAADQAGASAGASAPATSAPAVATTAASTTPQWADPASMFREGEMVWFKEVAWRIGIIALIDKESSAHPAAGDDSHFKYTITQLGHSMFEPRISVKTREDMRPFLTYSVPQSTVDQLDDKSFADVDWPAFAAEWAGADAQKRGVLQLEASKMAARAIDRSYSPFNRLPAAAAPPPGRQRYGGVFLGAEQIRLGDPVRVKAGPGVQGGQGPIMEVHEIYEEPSAGGVALGFAGITYRLAATPAAAAPAAPPGGPQPQSPALRREVEFRNRVQQAAGVRWAWRAEAAGVALREDDVAGRFYVTSELMQIVDPDQFRAALDRGEIEEALKYLNNRMHGAGEYVGRRPNRRATIGEAMTAHASAQLTMGEGLLEEI